MPPSARVWEAIAGYSGVLKVGEIVQLGPWLTTVDEILEPQGLSYELRVDESVLSCGDLRAFTEGGFAERLAALSAVAPLIGGQAILLSPLLEASQPSIGSTIHFQAGPLGELSHRAVGAFVP